MSKTLIQGALIPKLGYQDVLISNTLIEKVEPNIEAESSMTIIPANDCVLYPGLINTHHHLTQSLAKAVPAGINSGLGDWLGQVPYKLWPKLTPEIIYNCAVLGFYELIRSGATCCADHFYIYHRDVNLDIEAALYQAAKDVGIRFVHCRGGSTHLGSHSGNRSSNFIPETVDQFLDRLDETRKKHHDDAEDSMSKLVVAPTTIVHTSPSNDLVELARYARSHQLLMHTHMLEVPYDEEMAQQHYGMSAVDFAESVEWLGKDVWFAHCVQADSHAIEKLAATKTGVSHCPTSNCRLGSGIARIPQMHEKGVRVSIGVDGSASSESASMMNELMLTWLIHRSQNGSNATSVEQTLDWATLGGADILGYSQLGEIRAGALADFSIIDLNQPRFWGVWDKTQAPIVSGEPISVKAVFINGKRVFSNGELDNIDIHSLRDSATKSVASLMEA